MLLALPTCKAMLILQLNHMVILHLPTLAPFFPFYSCSVQTQHTTVRVCWKEDTCRASDRYLSHIETERMLCQKERRGNGARM